MYLALKAQYACLQDNQITNYVDIMKRIDRVVLAMKSESNWTGLIL